MIELVILFIKVGFAINLALVLASSCTWIERKVSAVIQDRVGANRAGRYIYTDKWYLKPLLPFVHLFGFLGLINTFFCDPLKGLTKEDFVPEGSSKFLHAAAPVLAVLPIILAFGALPLSPDFELFGMTIRTQVASLNAGALFVLAMGSVAVYGVAIAGWTGNNKFSLLGSLRAAAQMISYELPMGLCIVALAILYSSLDLYEMVMKQGEYLYGFIPAWGIILQPVGFVIFLLAGMAETKRGPFDLPEAESELSAGYFTEYSGMKFLMFWLGEFAEIALIAFLITLFYFGGWHIPFVTLPEGVWWAALIGHAVLITKVLFFCTLQVVIRWTLPRFRYDKLMDLGWKLLLPISIVNVIVTATLKVLV